MPSSTAAVLPVIATHRLLIASAARLAALAKRFERKKIEIDPIFQLNELEINKLCRVRKKSPNGERDINK